MEYAEASESSPPRAAPRWLARLSWPAGELLGSGEIAEVDRPGRSPAVLAIHGFGCTPNEVYLVTDLARELGLTARAPLLPGHGTCAEDLAKTRYTDWYSAAERELLRLAKAGPLIVAGQSMGSVIALDLALHHPEHVQGLVLLANATRLAAPYPDWALAMAAGLHLSDFAMPKFGGPDIRDPEARRLHRTYGSQPMLAALDLRKAAARVRSRLARVGCPTFVAHGKHDRVCPPSNAWAVAESLGTPDVELLLLARSGHIITKDYDRQLLAHRLREFLRRQASAPRDRAFVAQAAG